MAKILKLPHTDRFKDRKQNIDKKAISQRRSSLILNESLGVMWTRKQIAGTDMDAELF